MVRSPESFDVTTLGSPIEKSSRLFTAKCELAREGFSACRTGDDGTADDCLLGEEPRLVLIGERPFGTGKCVFALRCNSCSLSLVVGSGMEPVTKSVVTRKSNPAVSELFGRVSSRAR